MAYYELWDKTTANMLGWYQTRSEALAAAQKIVASDPRGLEWLALEWSDDDDEDAGGTLAEGDALSALLEVPRPSSVGLPRLASN
jgi:hypothetical protein